ncbi:MAG: hypothetical protein HMLKMBBP_02130 [Planctomycetes bacterium]|nr:hypothetical protein [Planctomycetota bacterium]
MGEQEVLGGRSGWRLALAAVLARLRFLALIALLIAAAAFWDRAAELVRGDRVAAIGPGATEHFCPMHPAVVRAAPGKCPSCAMPLAVRQPGSRPDLPEGTRARVVLAPYRIGQAGIRTEPASWRPLAFEVEARGVLRYEEAATRRFGAGFTGRVTSLGSTTDGATIRRGEPLVRIASAEVQAVAASYATSAKQLEDAKGRSASAAIERLRALTDQLGRQLLAWGFDQGQLELLAAHEPGEDVAIRAPFDCVVLHTDVSVGEQVVIGSPLVHVADPAAVVAILQIRRGEARMLRPGLRGDLVDPLRPEDRSEVEIVQVAPHADEAAQTVLVRARTVEGASAPARAPTAGSMVAARFRVPVRETEPWSGMEFPAAGEPRTVYECPPHGVSEDEPGICRLCGEMKLIAREVLGGAGPLDVLAVPDSAVVETGRAAFVFVLSAPGTFDAHVVRLGPRCGDSRPVISGIGAGERVAAAGAFLLDAETRLDPAAAAAYFGASEPR